MDTTFLVIRLKFADHHFQQFRFSESIRNHNHNSQYTKHLVIRFSPDLTVYCFCAICSYPCMLSGRERVWGVFNHFKIRPVENSNQALTSRALVPGQSRLPTGDSDGFGPVAPPAAQMSHWNTSGTSASESAALVLARRVMPL